MSKKRNQQEQTKFYFDKSAKDWQKKSNNLSIKIPVIQQRNSYVLEHIKKSKKKIKNFIDIGCGTGELVFEISKKEINSLGVDFSEKMISHCNKYSNKFSNFLCSDVLNLSLSKKYDLMAANGFIEYISLIELNKFLKNSHKVLSKNAVMIFSVRNRLFNILSLNQFTKPELKPALVSKLLHECLFFIEKKNLNELENLPTIDFQKSNFTHANTGIGVTSRFQYTPSQIYKILKKNNFKLLDIVGINTHLFPRNINSNVKEKNDIYFDINQPYKFGSLDNIPFSSTFMVKAKLC